MYTFIYFRVNKGALNIIFAVLLLGTVVQSKNCTFCGYSQVGVVFYPWVSIEDAFMQNHYSANDIVPLVSIVESEFHIVVVSFDFQTENTSIRAVPISVAQWNKEQITSRTSAPLDVHLLLGDSWTNKQTSIENLPTLLNFANQANAIYAETVTTIILYVDLLHTNFSTFCNTFKNFTTEVQSSTDTDYKVGLAFNWEAFEQTVVENISKKLLWAELYFNTFYLVVENCGEESFETSLNVVLQRLLLVLKSYKELLISTYPNPIELAVLAKCPDTTSRNGINYSRFLEFRKTLAYLASKENITVIFYTAFDSMSYGKAEWQDLSTSGWWRLIENSSYTCTTQFQFKDKITIAESETKKNNYMQLTEFKSGATFNRKVFGVEFTLDVTPFHQKHSQVLSKKVYQSMLKVVNSKFDYLYLKLNEKNPATKNIPSIVAKYNQDLSSPIKLILEINDDNTNNTVLNYVKMIKNANKMFPSNIVEVIWSAATLKTLRNIQDTNYSDSYFKIGSIFPIFNCSGSRSSFYSKKFQELTERLDIVYLEYYPQENYFQAYEFGVDRIVKQVLMLFETCKRRMQRVVGKEPGFIMGFDDTTVNGHDYASLVLIWKEMNAWASKTKTRVIMSTAFDTLNGPKTVYTGWWKVLDNYTGKDEISFEEKQIVAYRNLQKSLAAPAFIQFDKSYFGTYTISFVIGLVLVLIALSAVFYRWQQNRKVLQSYVNNPLYILLKESNKMVLPNAAIRGGASKLIGTGNFGMVYKTYMPQFQAHVALKTVKSCDCTQQGFDPVAAKQSVQTEIQIMCQVGQHANVLLMLGATVEEPWTIVLEYCVHGSLLMFLRSKANQKPCFEGKYDLLRYCVEIANGMQHLHKRGIIHGDLSARNVLLDGNLTCKISDFGLSRKLGQYEKYLKKGEEPLPWRWMAVESLNRLEFSSMSDVWSMGVTFWEVFSLGDCPFPNLTWDKTLPKLFMDGLRLRKPDLADESIYECMASCWQINPDDRPSAEELLGALRLLQGNEYIRM